MAGIIQTLNATGQLGYTPSLPTAPQRESGLVTKTYTNEAGNVISLPAITGASPALLKALTPVEQQSTSGESLTATGLTIKPLYYVVAVVALVVAYFVWKKYKK